jgi:FkbM family methyltransferase
MNDVRPFQVNDKHEPWLAPVIRTSLALRAGVFLDAGVNLGQTLSKVKTIEPSRSYLGFEPSPICCALAQQLILKNGWSNCSIVSVALGVEPGITKLFSNSLVDSSASLVEGFREPAAYLDFSIVPVFAGDYVLSTLGIEKIGAIKIDVEGGELEVLRGLSKNINRHRPHIFCEILPVYDDTTPIGAFRLQRQEAVQLLLGAERYVMLRIEHQGGLSMVRTLEVHSNLELSDYLFLPEEDLDAFVRAHRPR